MHPSDEPSLQVREIWPAGTVIKGDYVVQTKIGIGGFGTVYLAQHRFLGTTHVIKRLHEHFAANPEYVRKFVNEARAVRRLKDCPNVVEVEHMTQSEDGHLILVMEHISGGDLAGLMESRQIRVDEVVEFAHQIATGLRAAHASGLVHRDIKPQNVMISQNSTGKLLLKLIDFGIAADHLSVQQTSVMRGGSIGYAAPEQWVKAGKEIDGRADLYSLGASMYRMLCGRMPYQTSDIGEWIEQVRKGPPEAPARLRPEAPRALSDLILEMLSYSPEGRPPDAAAFLSRLEAFQPDRRGQSAEYPVASTFEKTIALPANTWKRKALGGGVAVAAVAGIFAVANRPQPPERKAAIPAGAVAVEAAPRPKGPAAHVDHAALGDAAVRGGNFDAALVHYKSLGDAKRLAALQQAVEGNADGRATQHLDRGEYAEALRLVDARAAEFPASQRLQALRAKILRARDSQ